MYITVSWSSSEWSRWAVVGQSSFIGEYLDAEIDEAAGLPRGRLNIRRTEDDHD